MQDNQPWTKTHLVWMVKMWIWSVALLWHFWQYHVMGHMNHVGWQWKHCKTYRKMQSICCLFCINDMPLGWYFVYPPFTLNNACTMLDIDFNNFCTTSTSMLFHAQWTCWSQYLKFRQSDIYQKPMFTLALKSSHLS
jgi:hypothetical protein